MSSKNGSAYADYEYLRAAVTQKEHTEHEYDVVVVTTITLRSSPFVLVVSIEARTAREGERDDHLALYQTEWPNASTTGWAATLFQAYVKLDRLVEDSRRDYEKEWTFRQA